MAEPASNASETRSVPDLTGRVAVVTGAAKRTGRALALAFAEAGADVAIHYQTSHDEAVEVARAIERSAKLLRVYIGKGAVPYGDHNPWIETHEDNGKCGMAAVLFNLMGEADGA